MRWQKYNLFPYLQAKNEFFLFLPKKTIPCTSNKQRLRLKKVIDLLILISLNKYFFPIAQDLLSIGLRLLEQNSIIYWFLSQKHEKNDDY
jgi:hypothetical protein